MNKEKLYNELTEAEKIIYDCIACGKENARTQSYISQITGFSKRNCRQLVQNIRLKGLPICIDNLTGYYIPETYEELRETLLILRSQRDTLSLTIKALEEAGDLL